MLPYFTCSGDVTFFLELYDFFFPVGVGFFWFFVFFGKGGGCLSLGIKSLSDFLGSGDFLQINALAELRLSQTHAQF